MRTFLAVLLLVGCDDGTTALIDATVDAQVADAQPDARPSDAALVDADLPDAILDAEPLDAEPLDAEPDAERPDAEPDAARPPPPRVRFSEAMAKNDGAWVDDEGETDDWLELINQSDAPVDLTDWTIGDDPDERVPVPAFPGPDGLTRVLAPGAVALLWADDEDRPGHLPFKISSRGETLDLVAPDGQRADRVRLGASAPNEAWARFGDDDAWTRCLYATPAAPNGDRCGPPPPPELPQAVEFAPYAWPDGGWPTVPQPLVIAEAALGAEGFVELLNSSDGPVDLADHSLTLAGHQPGWAWPAPGAGAALPLPPGVLAPGERAVAPLTEAAAQALAATDGEGVITLWLGDSPLTRLDFMAWPEGAALARVPDATGRHRFCAQPTPGAANACDPVPERPVPGRLRHLRTPGDFDALAQGNGRVGAAAVKWVMDLEGGHAVHLLSAARWDLHYTFVREAIDGQPHLDRCDPEENRVFRAGWGAFSTVNYREIEGREYLLGTLLHHGGAGLHTLEFASGDRITGPQMQTAFFGAMRHVLDPTRWHVRPQTTAQIEQVRSVEGDLPAVGPNAPYRGVTFQALTPAVGYGVLTFVAAPELDRTPLGPQVIVVTDQVPNDIPLTGGLITEAFQTPLAHVNLLSRNRGTPNMALVDARTDPRVAPLLGQLVRLEVAGADFALHAADPDEAEAFWASRRPDGPRVEPRLDRSVRGVQPLADHDLASLPGIGAKAAQLAELARVRSAREACPGPIALPQAPMAVPLVHSLEHYAASGALDRLATLEADPAFRADPAVRAAGLAEVRQLIEAHPVDPDLLRDVVGYVAQEFRDARVRFRSSSNTEDLPGFNGAGLYTSISAQLGDPDRDVADALRTVWASLYLARAYDEREVHHVDQSRVAMGVLVHPAFLSEAANGVGISRNVLEPIRRQSYFNLQVGEASVANPAPGVGTEQLIYDTVRAPRVRHLARSTLTGGAPVLTDAELAQADCALRAIHSHFEPRIDPEGDNPWFAVDIEFKLTGDARRLVVKQARPYSFGETDIPQDCRSL